MPSLVEPLPEPLRLARRRSDGLHGRQSRDRLITMLVMAGLLHGLILLGLSFSTPESSSNSGDKGMEVLLVSEELPEEKDNATATYLSQRTQSGSGNTEERRTARIPSQAQPGGPAVPSQAADPAEQLLASNSAGPATAIQIQSLAEPQPPAAPAAQRPDAQRSGDEELVLRGITRDELYVSADTRASRLAPYLDAWRRRIERIGTLNYPSVAQRRGMSGNPVIEVTLLRDGKLGAAKIQRSSGHPEIDAAALDILRLASPFDPFPPDLARDYRSLRFAYEWQFEGRGVSTSVSVP
jgi:protein TonB